MTSVTPTELPSATVPPHRPEVIAGLVNDGSARAVAAAAVREAADRVARVRFVQVIPVGERAQGDTGADDAVFTTALGALRGHSRIHCTFELATGEAHRVLVERSHRASLLVVGEDQSTPEASIAQYCRLHASCDVRTVPVHRWHD